MSLFWSFLPVEDRLPFSDKMCFQRTSSFKAMLISSITRAFHQYWLQVSPVRFTSTDNKSHQTLSPILIASLTRVFHQYWLQVSPVCFTNTDCKSHQCVSPTLIISLTRVFHQYWYQVSPEHFTSTDNKSHQNVSPVLITSLTRPFHQYWQTSLTRMSTWPNVLRVLSSTSCCTALSRRSPITVVIWRIKSFSQTLCFDSHALATVFTHAHTHTHTHTLSLS